MPEGKAVIRTQELPILDIGGFLSGNHADLELLAGQLRVAAAEFGFFFIKNHGISEKLIKNVLLFQLQ